MKPSSNQPTKTPLTTTLLVLTFMIICLPTTTIGQESSEADANSAQTASQKQKDWEKTLLTLRWIAYAPTHFDPTRGVFPSAESILEDLRVLHEGGGFDGLITYGADNAVIEPAKVVGFRGVLLGVWDPTNPSELDLARAAAKDDIVVGLIVGNEGLEEGGGRYDYQTLKNVMDDLAHETGKPVSTTEQLEDYRQERMRDLGDWLCPNVHPYWHNITEPSQAVEWTVQQFERLSEQTNKVVLIKEVGMPTDGDERVSEDVQAEYYRLLMQTKVHFVFFEAFDQPWKRHAPVEPFWGLFHADRSPKKVVQMLRPTTHRDSAPSRPTPQR